MKLISFATLVIALMAGCGSDAVDQAEPNPTVTEQPEVTEVPQVQTETEEEPNVEGPVSRPERPVREGNCLELVLADLDENVKNAMRAGYQLKTNCKHVTRNEVMQKFSSVKLH